MRFKTISLPLVALAVSCGGADTPATDEASGGMEASRPAESAQVDMGPQEYDAGGTMECSVGGPAWDEACGFRVVRDDMGGAEIWISNIAGETEPAYRVLTFSEGEFSARDGTPLEVSRDADMWTVVAEDGGHFRFAHAVITGG